MSTGVSCRCEKKDRTQWRIVKYRCNNSAFNGYHTTPSDYSAVCCLKCNASWRTKAAYVVELAPV